jgi:hypothetical protein
MSAHLHVTGLAVSVPTFVHRKSQTGEVVGATVVVATTVVPQG